MQGSLLIEKGLKYSLDPTQWRNPLAQKLNSNLEFIGLSIQFVVLKDINTDNKKRKNHRIVAPCVPVDSWVFRNWILFDYQKAVCYQKKKHFSFTDSTRYSFSSRSFHTEAQKAFDFNVALSQGHVRGPVWRWSSAKTVISYLKSFQTTVCFMSWYFCNSCCNMNRISIVTEYALKKLSPYLELFMNYV